jgi:hypothetical protein
MGSEEERGFKVDDRRRFSADGVKRGEEAQESPAAAEVPRPPPPSEPRELPELDFSTFVLSLTTSAMVHLGEAPHPDRAVRKELTLAKQTIDLLGLLREKTKGNLTEEESKLMDEVLYDLRLRYVSAAR